MKLSTEEFDKLKDLLSQKTTWTTEEVRAIIYQEFEVEYTLKQIRIILKKLKMGMGNHSLWIIGDLMMRNIS